VRGRDRTLRSGTVQRDELPGQLHLLAERWMHTKEVFRRRRVQRSVHQRFVLARRREMPGASVMTRGSVCDPEW
jgi:hypothetical protein